jgi:hypothetical protein
MKMQRVLAIVHFGLALAFLVFAVVGEWSKVVVERVDFGKGVFDAQGGSGFGIVAVLVGILLVALAVMRLMGKDKVLPGLGVEQLTVILGLVATLVPIAFIVGWLKVFDYKTGWAIPALYFTGSFIPQLGLLTLSLKEPVTGVTPIDESNRRIVSGVALLGAAGIALFPLLTWISSGSVKLSGYESGGPRLAMIMLWVGCFIAVAAFMRLRPQGLAEPGPNLLLSHALLAGGVVAFAIPVALVISVLRFDGNLDIGVGVWLGILASLVLIGAALYENRLRGAQPI